MGEFELIRRFFCSDQLQPARRDVGLAVGDDCALITVPQNKQLAVSVDTSVAGVHFLPDSDPYCIGWRALAVSLSDLAAMGAKPAWFTLALTLEETDEAWLGRFAQGVSDLAQQYGISLVGGDTTRGHLTVTVQVQGYITGSPWLRSGAKPGEIIYVSGPLGNAAGGLALLQSGIEPPDIWQELVDAYLLPKPRFDLISLLSSRISSAIDISDGFLVDLKHILDGSKVGAQLDLTRIPVSDALEDYAGRRKALEYALSGGDDYQLCFTVTPQRRLELEVSAEQSGLQLFPVGVVTEEQGIEGIDDYAVKGFEHFYPEEPKA